MHARGKGGMAITVRGGGGGGLARVASDEEE